jgi:hypothetical protein
MGHPALKKESIMPEQTFTGLRHKADGSVVTITETREINEAGTRPQPANNWVSAKEFLGRLELSQYASIRAFATNHLVTSPHVMHWFDMLIANNGVDVASDETQEVKKVLLDNQLLSDNLTESLFAPGS